LANSYALLLCTDGFWNSQHTHQNQPPQGLLDLLATLPAGADAAAVAEKCVSTANDQDGGDNITVIVQFT
jgi:serine/threonine protein phosphatase PrpC